jgi:O-antigen/teichoic acid export membrane protein
MVRISNPLAEPVDLSDATGAVSTTLPRGRANLRRAARGAIVETLSYGLSLAIRLGSNLILTRLLAPEVFGLFAMVQMVLFGLTMLSDVGLSQAVVAHPRGDDDDFLNVTWSIQVVRNVGLTLGTLAMTWPAALWFKEPQLLWVLPFASIATLVQGFSSTRMFTSARHVHLGPLVALELSRQVIMVAIGVTGAYLGHGVLALLVGQLVAAGVEVVGSHCLPCSRHRDRWNWDPQIRREILRFGRWIFFSSALTVVASRGDSALLGRYLGTASLGLYNLAVQIADLPESLGMRIVNTVLYPTLSITYQQEPHNFAKVYYRLRLYFDAVAHTALGGLCALSMFVIELLYDDRYLGAGAMLGVFALRSSVGLMSAPWESAFFARGHTHFGFRRSLITSAAVMIAMPLGYHYFGAAGVIWGTVVARATALLVLWPAAHAEGWLKLHREMLVPAFLVLGYTLGQGVLWLGTRLLSAVS